MKKKFKIKNKIKEKNIYGLTIFAPEKYDNLPLAFDADTCSLCFRAAGIKYDVHSKTSSK